MEELELEVTVNSNSHLPPKVECPRTPLENLVSPFLNHNISSEVLHTNPLGELCVLERQHTPLHRPKGNGHVRRCSRYPASPRASLSLCGIATRLWVNACPHKTSTSDTYDLESSFYIGPICSVSLHAQSTRKQEEMK